MAVKSTKRSDYPRKGTAGMAPIGYNVRLNGIFLTDPVHQVVEHLRAEYLVEHRQDGCVLTILFTRAVGSLEAIQNPHSLLAHFNQISRDEFTENWFSSENPAQKTHFIVAYLLNKTLSESGFNDFKIAAHKTNRQVCQILYRESIFHDRKLIGPKVSAVALTKLDVRDNEVKNYDFSSSSLSLPLTSKIIGSGGFGMIVAEGNVARKLIYIKSAWVEGAREFQNIKILYQAVVRARMISQNPEVSSTLEKLNPLSPIDFAPDPFEYCGIGFSCQIHTKLIPGLSTALLQLPIEFQRDFPHILVMPVFWEKIGISLKNESEDADLVRNPPRYYIMSMEDAQKLYSIDFQREFPFAMGVLLAVFTFGAHLSMIDVEILLGPIESSNINVVDLGMCQDISNAITSRDIEKICAAITDLSGPFYTKNSFPLPGNQPQFDNFIEGFEKTAMELGEPQPFIQALVLEIKKELQT